MDGEGTALRIRLCGDLGIEAPGIDLPPGVLPGRQGRLVLAYLVCARGRAVTRDELAELLWPDRLPESWTTSLSAVVSKLRRLLAAIGLEADALVSSNAGIALELPDDVWVDWEVAQQAMAVAEAAVAAGQPESAIEAAAEALELADRGFLADPCPWVDAQQDAARDVGVRSVIALGEAHLLAGSFGRAVDAGRDAVARAPGREAGHRLLMRALAASGERAEALRAWERCRAEVIDELGVEPSAETEAVYLQLLDAEPSAAPVPSAGLPSGVVTFLFTDIVESSALWERDAAAMDRVLERHDALIGEVVSAHGGTLLKSRLEGDATVSVFGRATSAVLATLAIADALATEPWPEDVTPVLRMAVHTGEAVERGGDYFGPALNRAARLRALAGPGQVLLSQAAAEVVVDHLPEGVRLSGLGHRDLRGLSRGEHVYELAPEGDAAAPEHVDPLLASRPPLPTLFASGDPFVGRDHELALLTEAFASVASSGPRAVLIAGEPGVGKTRLAAEAAVTAHRAGAVVLAGRCDEELGAPLQPFAECLHQLAPHLDAGRLARVQGVEELGRLVPGLAGSAALDAPRADPDGERYALFDGFARLLAAVADEAPVVLVLDDLHWAGKTTLLLLRHLLRHAGPAPLLVLGTYRDTELGRTHPLAATLADLRRDGTADRLTLTGLEPDDVAAYLRAVGREDRDLGTELARVTAGNPFFLIETLRHVVESGGRWDPDELPEGVREATGRRLSRLSEPANELLHVAAVAGPVFSLELVEEICGRELVDEIAEACDAGLVREDDGRPGRFRFAHALVRQVLLGELVTIRRVRLHRAIAERIEANPASDPDVQLTELARHWFECASAGDADRAVAACRRAADRAAERLAYAEAAELYGMAAQAGAGASEDEQAELLVARVEALLAAGDAGPARGALDDLEAAAGTSARWTSWHATLSGQLAVVADPERLTGIIAGLRDAATVLHDEGDGRGEARAHYVHALALERLGRIGAAEQTLDRALAAARDCGDRRLVDVVLASAPEAALWGPSPVTRASGRCLDVVRVLRITGGAPAVEAVALRCQAVLEALRGRLDAARTMVAAARRTFEELGLAPHLLETDVAAGHIELAHAHPAEAEAHLRPALEALRERGLDGETARAAALLGRALLAQGRVDEAEALGEEAARLAGADLRAGVGWRAVLALVAAARDDRPEALRLAREAVELSSATDALLLEVDARMALAEVLRTVGEDDAAIDETRRALELCERKGATALAELTARRLPDATPRSEGGPGTDAGVPVRHIRENVATAGLRELEAMLSAGDLAGFVERATGVIVHSNDVGDLTSEQALAYLGVDNEAPLSAPLTAAITPLATLGPHLVLNRGDFDIEDAKRPDGWGDAHLELVSVSEFDEEGGLRHMWLVATSQLGAAIMTLYERFAETSGSDRAAAVAGAVSAWRAANDELTIDDVLELDLDHLVLVSEGQQIVLRFAADGALESETRVVGRRVVRENLATAFMRRITAMVNAGDLAGFIEIASRATTHTYEVGELTPEQTRELLSGSPDAGLATTVTPLATLGERHFLYHGAFHLADTVTPESWGDSQMENLTVFELEDDGRHGPVWLFPVTQIGPAVVALYEQFGAPAPARVVERWCAINDHVVLEDVLELDLDHVVLVGRDGDQTRDVVLQFGGWDRFGQGLQAGELVASRGERLTLAETSGVNEVREIDDRGQVTRTAAFEPDDLDAAYATLDDWYAEGDGATTTGFPLVDLGQFAHPDRARFDAYYSPELVVEDHRLAGPASWVSPDEYYEFLDGMRRDLADFRIRLRHVLRYEHGFIAVVDQSSAFDADGSGRPAPYEMTIVSVSELADDGRVVRMAFYDEDQVVEAFAEYDALVAAEPRSARPGWERFEAFHFVDGDQLAANLAPDVTIEDHRSLVGLQAHGIDDVLERWQQMQRDTSLRVTTDLVASRGEHFAIDQVHLQGQWGMSGDAEVSFLSLVEVNDDRKTVRMAFFDLEDRERAFAALDEWYLATRELTWPSMLSSRDTYDSGEVERSWTNLAPHVVLEDHRLFGHETFRGQERVTEFLFGMRRGLTSVGVEVLHVLEHERAGIYVGSMSGSVTAAGPDEGASFQSLIVSLTEYDDAGLAVRWEIYEDDQLPEALARYDALAPEPSPPPSFWEAAVDPNHLDGGDDAFNARDAATYASILRPDLWVHDFRTGHPQEYGRDELLASLGFNFDDASLQKKGRLMGSRAPRFALVDHELRGTWGSSGPVELDLLSVSEVDDDGIAIRTALYEVDQLEAALDTLEQWYVETRDPTLPTDNVELRRRYLARDWDGMRELFAADLVVEDHRLTGREVHRSRDEYFDHIRSMLDQLVEADIRSLHLTESRQGVLALNRHTGMLDVSGERTSFESLIVIVQAWDGDGLVRRWDFYDEYQLPEAVARYEALTG